MKQSHSIGIFTFLLPFLFCQLSFSQGLKIKEFKQSINDGSAFHAPLDSEGHSCGLIKVRTNNPDIHYKGNIVGDVENKLNEYWVYVVPGSKSLKILHPNYMPFMVSFDDYGIDIVSKATYILTIEETKFKKEKTGVTIIVKPENSNLFIDDIPIDNLGGNGYYQLYLPKGEHICKISKTGYRSNVQIIQTGKTQQNLDIELESVLAELKIKCKTTTAELYIDEDFKGNGAWEGKLLAGEHKIEARQKNFISINQMIVLEEKESKIISLPELKRSVAKLLIETNPSHIPVIVDGDIKGTSPFELEIETGVHLVTSETYGCSPYRGEVAVEDNKENTLKISLNYTDFGKETYIKAYKDDKEAIRWLAQSAMHMAHHWSCEDYEKEIAEAIFWAERCPDPNLYNNVDGYDSDAEYYHYWISAYCDYGKPEKALQFYEALKQRIRDGHQIEDKFGCIFSNEETEGTCNYYMSIIGDGYMKLQKYNEAIKCYEVSKEHGYEGLGDCYAAKGDKQKAVMYYRKAMNSIFNSDKIQKKLNDIEKASNTNY